MAFFAAFVLAATSCATAQQFYAKVTTPQIGYSIGTGDNPGIFINWLKGCGSPIYNGSATPQMLDANMYPNAAPIPTGSSIFCSPGNGLSNYNDTWEWFFSGTGQPELQFASFTVVSNPAPSPVIPNAQTCTVSGTMLAGTNCDVIISFNSSPPNLGHLFTAGSYTGFSNEGLIRSTDKTAYLSGQVFTPEWVALHQQSAPLFERVMGQEFSNQFVENETSWNVRIPVLAFSYVTPYYPPAIWAAADLTNTDNYVLGSYPTMPSQWTDSEVFQFKVSNASNAAITATAATSDSSTTNCGGTGGCVQLTVGSTGALTNNQNVLVMNCQLNTAPRSYLVTVVDSVTLDLQGTVYSSGAWSGCTAGVITTTTINVGGRGAVFAVRENVLGAANITANAIWTCHYDALLNILLCASGGINAEIPPEVLVEEANELGSPLWFSIPPFWQVSDVTSFGTYANSHLTEMRAQFNNENWNFLFQAQNWAQRGLALGWSLSNNQAQYSYIGLRYRQLMPSLIATWTHGRSHLHIEGDAQAYGNASQFGTYEFAGSVLCGASCGNSAYQNAIGVDYNVSPNRPKDFMDDYTIASYWQGAQECQNKGTLVTLAGVINAAAEYASGDTTDAYNFLYNDSINGTGPCSSFTVSQLEAGPATSFNSLAATDGKGLIAYEGGYSSAGPTAAYLTSIGDGNATADATNINNMLVAFRSSNQFYQIFSYAHQQWIANSKVIGDSNLAMQGTTINVGSPAWNTLQGGIYPAVPYQNFFAIRNINLNLNFLLHRDLDPANDNDYTPLGLNEAA